MKNMILAEFLRRVQTTPNLKKKMKFLLGIGLVVLLLAGTLTIYIGVKGVKYIAGLASNLEVAQHTESLKSQVEAIPAVSAAKCLDTAQDLMNIDKLLSTPIKDNFQTLKSACFEELATPPNAGKKEGELI